MEKTSLKKIFLVICIIMTLLAPSICADIVYAMDEDVQDEVQEDVTEPESTPSQEENNDQISSEPKQDLENDSLENFDTPEISEDEESEALNTITSEDEGIDTETISNIPVETLSLSNEPMPIASTNFVKSGNGTLQQAIESAEDGDVLQLENGSYTGSDIIINKPITIKGSGLASRILSKIIVRGTNENPKVVLKDLFLGNQQVPTEQGYKFINIESPVNMEINNVATNFVYRNNPDSEAITLNMEKSSEGSTLNINNSSLYSAINGIKVESSKNNITLSNTFLYGKYAFIFSDGGKNNTLTVNQNSTISGRSSGYYADEAIQIIGQDGLKIDISDSEIRGNDARGDRNTHIFSFDGTKPSTNVTINIAGTTVINDVNPLKGSTIFNFGNSTPDSNNVIKIGRNVSMTPSTVEYKYNTSENYAVVGIYDEYGDSTVKVYNKNQAIPEGDYESEISNWYKVTSSTEDFNIKNSVNENMDLHPMPTRETQIKVKIQGQEQEYSINIGQSYTANEQLKTQLESLKNVQDKTFSNFVTQDGIIIDENTKIYKDTTITPKYKVTVTIKNKDGGNDEYQIEEGQNLSYISQEQLDKYEKETANDTKKFSRYRQIGSAKFLSVSKSIPIEKNIELEPVYYVTVTIKVGEQEKTYNIDENESLQSYYSTQATLTQLKEFVNSPNKEFQYFIVDEEEDTHADYNTTISKHTTLTAKYKVKVTVYQADGTTKDYLLEEGQSLDNLDPDILAKLKESMNNGKTITGYVNEKGGEVDFDTPVKENMSFEPVYYDKVKVTIKDVAGKEYELADGANLNTLDEQHKTDFMNAVNKEDKTLAYFTNAKGETITFETPITQDMELIPVYNVTITVSPKNAQSETIEVLEGTTFGDTKLQESLEKYKVDNKSLEGFIYEESKTPVNNDDEFKKHTTIIPKYTITITVKTNANEEGKTISGVDEGATLESLEQQLSEYNNVDKKTLAKYVDSNGREVPQTEQLNENITITPIYNVTVTINGEEYTLEENASLASLEAEQLKTIREAIEVDNKTFSNFVNEDGKFIDFYTAIDEDMKLTPKYKVTVKVVDENGNTVLEETIPENDKLTDLDIKADKLKQDLKLTNKLFTEEFTSNIDDNTYDFETPIPQNITLTPKYNVEIIIKGTHYTLPEGGKIQDLGPEKITEIETAVDETSKTFKKQFVDEKGNVVYYDTPINQNATLTPKYDVTVTIKTASGDKTFTIEEGKKLSDIEDQENYKKTMEKDYRIFSRFVYTDASGIEQTFDIDKDTINTNITLTPKFKVTIKVNDIYGNELKSVEIEEGQNLASKSDELTSVEHPENKTFIGYYEENSKIEPSAYISDNKTLIAKYEVTIQIGNQTFTVNEGSTLQNLLDSNPDAKQALEDLRNSENGKFSRFADTEGNTVEDTTVFNKNTEIIPIYNIKVQVEKADGTIEEFAVEEGKTLNDLSNEDKAKLQAIKDNHAEGWRFAKFVDVETGEEIGENTPITKDTVIKSVYEEIPAEEAETTPNEDNNGIVNPKTSDNILNFVALGLIGLACIVISIIAYRRKNK